MRPHLFIVDLPAPVFAPLIGALREAGMRAGWLELAAPRSVPENLEAAAAEGVLRAVSIGGGRSVAVKPMASGPVLRDLLREHFNGTAAVLVRGDLGSLGDEEAPRLEPHETSWRVSWGDGTSLLWTSKNVVAALRRPRLRRNEAVS